MASRARIVAVLGVLLAAVLVTLGAATAQAAPYSGAAAVSVSESSPCHGGAVTVSGVGYAPGSTVVLSVGGTVIGRAKVDASGGFDVRITLPGTLTGTRTIVATGSSGGLVATTRIAIRDCSSGGTDPGGAGTGGAGAGDGGGGLSTTGVAVMGLLVVALGLVAGGIVLMVGGRRRRSTAQGAA